MMKVIAFIMIEHIIDGVFNMTRMAAVRMPLAKPESVGVKVLDLPGYVQLNSYCCGVTAGFMVSQFYHSPVTFGDFYDWVNPNPVDGCQTDDVMKALRRSGVKCQPCGFGFKSIQRNIDSGRPMLLSIRNPRKKHHHMVVVYGYGVQPNRVFIAVNGWPIIGQCLRYQQLNRLAPRGLTACSSILGKPLSPPRRPLLCK